MQELEEMPPGLERQRTAGVAGVCAWGTLVPRKNLVPRRHSGGTGMALKDWKQCGEHAEAYMGLQTPSATPDTLHSPSFGKPAPLRSCNLSAQTLHVVNNGCFVGSSHKSINLPFVAA
jgi:hypothetical protein